MNKILGQTNLLVACAILTIVTVACSVGGKSNSIAGNSSSNSGSTKSYATPTSISTSTPNPAQTPVPAEARWVLDSVTAVPESKSGWTYNAQSTSAHEDIYNGDTHDYKWTKPPTQIDSAGFTITYSTECQSQPKNVCASIMGASGTGLEAQSSSEDRKAAAKGEDGSIGRGEKSATFKLAPNATDVQLEVGLGWGDVKFIYKYRRAQ